jgi:hypothetical protein
MKKSRVRKLVSKGINETVDCKKRTGREERGLVGWLKVVEKVFFFFLESTT